MSGPAPETGRIPLVGSHETWSGEVRLGGAVVVAAGASVTLEPGTRVLLAPGARLVVRGRLTAAGTADAPVSFEAAAEAPWGGLWVADDGQAALSHARLSGLGGDGAAAHGAASLALSDCSVRSAGRFGVNFRSSGALKLSRCAVEGGAVGLAAHGGTVDAEDCSFTGAAETGLELRCEARLARVRAAGSPLALKVLGGKVDAEGLELSGEDGAKAIGDALLRWTGGSCQARRDALGVEGARVELRGARLSGGERGAALDSGRLEAEGASFEGQARLGLWCAEGATAALSRCAFSGPATGAAARGPLEARGCSFSGHAEAGLDLGGTGHLAEGCRFEACGTGVKLDGQAALSALEMKGVGTGVSARPGARLTWESGRCEASLSGLELSGCEARVKGVTFSGGARGAAAEGGALFAQDCAFERQSDGAVLCSAGASAELSSCRFDGPTVGASARGGSKISWTGGSCAASSAGLTVDGGEAAVRGARFSGGERAVDLGAGALEAEDSAFDGQTVLSVRCGEKARATLTGCRFSGAPTAVAALGPVRVSGCSFSGHGGSGLELGGPGHQVTAARLSGCGRALVLEGEAELSDVEAEGRLAGASVRKGSRLVWRAGRAAAGEGGAALELEGARAKLEGLTLSGGRAGVLLAGSALEAEDCAFERQGEACARVDEVSRLCLARCRMADAPTGVAARGPVTLDGCALSGHAQAALDLHGRGHSAERTAISGCGAGAVLDGEARFARFEAESRGAAVSLRPGSRLEWTSGAARCAEGRGALLSEDAEALLSELAVENGAGRASLALGGRWSVSGCRFKGAGKGAALEIDGGEHELRGVSAAGAGTGLLLSSCACRCDDGSFEGAREGLVARAGAALEWLRGSAQGAYGARVEGASARLEGVALRAALVGARVEEGSLRLSAGTVSGGRESCVLLEKGAFAELRDLELRDSPVAVAVRAGHLHLLEGVRAGSCDAGAVTAAGATVCLRAPLLGPAAGAPPKRRALLEFVLATRGSLGWRALYRAAYAGAAWALRARLALTRGVEAAALHRGWTGGDWEPGVSDLDALVLGTRLSGMGGARWLRALWRRYAGWKRLAPFLGETLVARREEAAAYVRAGGARAQALAARLPGPWPACAPETADSRLLERVHAYTRLVQCGFDAPREPWARNARQAAKGLLDVLRFERPGPAPSRRQAAEELLAGSGPRRRAFETLLGPAPDDAAAALFLAAGHALAALDESLPGAAVSAVPAGAPPADGDLDALVQPFGAGLLGALADDLSRSFVVLDARAARPEELARSLSSCALRRSLRAGTLPVPMTASLWRAFAPLPYLDDPTRRLGFAGAGGAARRDAGRLLEGSRQTAWGLCAAPVAADPVSAAAAAACAAGSFAVTWRWLGCPSGGGDPRAVFHHLLGRGLGLRLLLERGVELPFHGLDALAERAAAEFPDLRESLARLEPLREGAGLEEAFFANYALVDGLARDAAAAARRALDGAGA